MLSFKKTVLKNLKNKKLLFLPILLLTVATAVPMLNLILGKMQFEASQKTKLTAFLVIPGVPVFSTDDFFEYVYFQAETSSGKKLNIKWEDLIDEQYKNNFVNYVYMRHVFNTRTNGKRSKVPLISYALKKLICARPGQYSLPYGETFLTAEYFVTLPLEKNKIKNQIKVTCRE